MKHSDFSTLTDGDVIYGRLPSHCGWAKHPALLIDGQRRIALLGSSKEPIGGTGSIYVQSTYELQACGLKRPTRFEMGYALAFYVDSEILGGINKIGRLPSHRMLEMRARLHAAALNIGCRCPA